ncbi:hypothetical protein ACOMHN_005442 [Nucella lapillus]
MTSCSSLDCRITGSDDDLLQVWQVTGLQDHRQPIPGDVLHWGCGVTGGVWGHCGGVGSLGVLGHWGGCGVTAGVLGDACSLSYSTRGTPPVKPQLTTVAREMTKGAALLWVMVTTITSLHHRPLSLHTPQTSHHSPQALSLQTSLHPPQALSLQNSPHTPQAPVTADFTPFTTGPVTADFTPFTTSPVTADFTPFTTGPVTADFTPSTTGPVTAHTADFTPSTTGLEAWGGWGG